MSKKQRFQIEKEVLEKYLQDHLSYKQIADKCGVKAYTIMKICHSFGLRSDLRQWQMLHDNPSKHKEVCEKISKTIKKQWEDGVYSQRVNGMLGKHGKDRPNYSPKIANTRFMLKAHYYHPEATCLMCGKEGSYEKYNRSLEVHHVDRNHNNSLLTNLMPLCHSCHRLLHQPYAIKETVRKDFVFDACHYLPHHERKCKFLHGHTYHLSVYVTNYVIPETNMVMDFGKLKDIVNNKVIEQFDHNIINSFIDFPTAENMLVWIWFALSKDVKGLSKLDLWETDGSCATITAESVQEFMKVYEEDWRK